MTVRWNAQPTLRRPAMVAAFSGWNDAADAATDAVRWLARATNARPFASLDIEEYIDFQASRPTVELVEGVIRSVTWPSLAFSGGAIAASASPSAHIPVYIARRAVLSGSSGSSTTANSARSKRPT